MTTLSGMLDLSRRALSAQQLALAIVGHNTANVNTPGFSRQRIQLSPSWAFQMAQGSLGTGVNVVGIQQIHDYLLDRNLRQSYSDFSQWEAIDNSLQSLENIFGDTSTSTNLEDLLTQFWNSWQDLANDPENLTARTSLRENAQSLCSEFNRLHTQFASQLQSHDQEIVVRVNEVNTKAAAIADLNARIAQIESSGGMANDLRDQRTALLNDSIKRNT